MDAGQRVFMPADKRRNTEAHSELPYTSPKAGDFRVSIIRARATIAVFHHWNYRSAKRASDTNLQGLWRPAS
jgi:hypothetical protein